MKGTRTGNRADLEAATLAKARARDKRVQTVLRRTLELRRLERGTPRRLVHPDCRDDGVEGDHSSQGHAGDEGTGRGEDVSLRSLEEGARGAADPWLECGVVWLQSPHAEEQRAVACVVVAQQEPRRGGQPKREPARILAARGNAVLVWSMPDDVEEEGGSGGLEDEKGEAEEEEEEGMGMGMAKKEERKTKKEMHEKETKGGDESAKG